MFISCIRVASRITSIHAIFMAAPSTEKENDVDVNKKAQGSNELTLEVVEEKIYHVSEQTAELRL